MSEKNTHASPPLGYLLFIALVVMPLRLAEIIANITIKLSIWAEQKAEQMRQSS